MKAWIVAFAVAMVVAVFQTSQLREAKTELYASAATAERLQREVLVWKDNVLRQAVDAAGSLTGAGIPTESGPWVIMVTDQSCGACARAMQTFRDEGAAVPIYLASFVDDVSELNAWSAPFSVRIAGVLESIEASPLKELPRNATPVFMEFRGGVPVDVHLGQPKSYWLSKAPQGGVQPELQ